MLRLGHRRGRDERVSTHLALVARAFGADKVIFTLEDENVMFALEDVNRRFGGHTEFIVVKDWKSFVKRWGGIVVHLTMYGLPLDDVIDDIRRKNRVLVIVGAEKVPGVAYSMADYNISVSNQPHSEIAALAVFLDRYFNGSIIKRDLGGELRIIPQHKGKMVVENRIPTKEECIALLRKHGCSEHVIEHCIAVERLAVRIAREAKADVRLVSAGSLLHDIGRGTTHGVEHGVVGAEILRKEGVIDSIVNIVERHLGAGIDLEEAKKLGLPPKDYIPKSLEEKIVAHADNLIDHNRKVGVEKIIRRLKNKGLVKAAERVRALHHELSHICGIDLDKI